jgi:hypothetical protein
MAHWICWAIASEREFMVFVMVLVAAATFLAIARHRRLDVSSWPPAAVTHDRVGMAAIEGAADQMWS